MKYSLEFDLAFHREKQVQGWRREKKEALIKGDYKLLPKLAMAHRDIQLLCLREIQIPDINEWLPKSL